MGQSPGAGYPLTFRCSKCKLGDWRRGERGTNYSILGRVKLNKRGENIRMDADYKYRYKCLDCGFKGWTRHSSVRTQWTHKNN